MYVGISSEVGGALIQAAAAIIVVCLGFRWGNKLTTRWALYQKRRELDLAAAHDLYALYGEFFAIWKLWGHYRKLGEKYGNDPKLNLLRTVERKGEVSSVNGGTADPRLQLLERASNAEGRMEALLIKIASERSLSHDDWVELGKFRQAFQLLRDRIRRNEGIGWHSSQELEYLTFKRLACFVATLLHAAGTVDDYKAYNENHHQAYLELHDITNNCHQSTWLDDRQLHEKILKGSRIKGKKFLEVKDSR